MKRVVNDLTNADWRMRESAVEIMLHAGHFPKEAVATLRTLLKTEPHENVRRAVVSALTAANPPDLSELLLEALGDSDYMVRSRAFAVLTRCLPEWQSNKRIVEYMEGEVHPLGIWHIQDAIKQ